MRFFGFGKKADKNVPVLSVDEVRQRLWALNRPSAPWQIVDDPDHEVDLIAEWKIVDAQWYEIFAKAKLSEVFRIYMKFDTEKHQVRAKDEQYDVSWHAGVPTLKVSVMKTTGQVTSVSFGMGYSFTEEAAPGQVYKYHFNTNEIKKPIQEAVAACGWEYKGIAFGKL